MSSFKQRFAEVKSDNDNNSRAQGIILEEILEEQEQLKAITPQETIPLPEIEIDEEKLLGQEMDVYSVESLFESLEHSSSPEDVAAIISKYEGLMEEWGDKASLVRSEKNLKKYLTMTVALAMLQKMLQSQELISGKKLSENLQVGLKSQTINLSEQTQKLQLQNKRVMEQPKPNLLKSVMHELQHSIKQIQLLKESPKPVEHKRYIEPVQKIHLLCHKLIESGKLPETTIHTLKQIRQHLPEIIHLPKDQSVRMLKEIVHVLNDKKLVNNLVTEMKNVGMVQQINKEHIQHVPKSLEDRSRANNKAQKEESSISQDIANSPNTICACNKVTEVRPNKVSIGF
jgi:hypothetical protein